MPQSLSAIWLHLIFSTKDRQQFLTNDNVRDELHRYMGGTLIGLECHSLIVGGATDHVHCLFALGRTNRPADVVRDLKRASSIWIKERRAQLAGFEWQRGYAIFSVSHSHVDMLKEYIQNQMEHHRKESFQDEVRRILAKYGVEFDERYLWD